MQHRTYTVPVQITIDADLSKASEFQKLGALMEEALTKAIKPEYGDCYITAVSPKLGVLRSFNCDPID